MFLYRVFDELEVKFLGWGEARRGFRELVCLAFSLMSRAFVYRILDVLLFLGFSFKGSYFIGR